MSTGKFTNPSVSRGPDVMTANGIKPTYKISEGNFINSGGEYAPTRPSQAGVLVDGAGRPIPMVASKTGAGSGANPLAQAANAGTSRPPQDKYNASANAAQTAQQAQKNANKNTASKQPAPTKTTTSPKPSKSKGGGGGGGSRGGGKREKSPEQKARDQGRYDRTMDRENRRTAAAANRRDAEEYAKSRGFNSVKAMQDKDANQAYFDKYGPNKTANTPNSNVNTPGAPFDRNKPVKDPYSGEMMSVDDYETLARERIKNDKSLNPSEEKGGGGGGGGGSGPRRLVMIAPGVFRYVGG